MPLDTSIYFKGQNALGDGFQQGMSIGSMARKSSDERKLKEAYAQGGGDSGKTLSALANAGFGKEAMEMKQQAQNDELFNMKKQQQEIETIASEAMGVSDQSSYERALGNLSKRGVDVSSMPQAYDPKLVQGYLNRSLSYLEKLKLDNDAMNRKEARDERRFQHGIKTEEKLQGLKTPYGLANTEEDAKNLKAAHEAKSNFDNKIQQMIDLREKHGGGASWNREDVARGKQLSKDLLLMYKDMAKLGVLSAADEKILNAIIPEDPLEYNSPLAAIQGQDPTLSRLKSFQNDSNKDFSNRVSTRTREGLKQALSDPKAGEKSAAVPTTKKTNEIDWAD